MENNNFISDAELIGYINNALGELDDILIGTYTDYRANNYQSILSGESNILPIAPDFYKLLGVDYQLTAAATTYWFSLKSFQFPERNRQNAISMMSNPWTRLVLSYRLFNDGIMILPQQQCQGNYQVWYVPKLPQLINLTDQLSITMDNQGWVQYVAAAVAIIIFNKQNLDSSAFMQQKEQLRTRIVSMSRNRDAAVPKRCANTRYNEDFYFPSFTDGSIS
jgi:hypothetical protein